MRASKLFLIFIILLTVFLCLCAGQKPAEVKVTPTPVKTTPPAKVTPTPTPTPKPTPTPSKIVSAGGVKPVDGQCLNCHNNPLKRMSYPQVFEIPGHINGSAYCKYCHVPNVTKMTQREIDEYITKFHHETKYAQEGNCQFCHKLAKGENIKNCGTCHQNGNLIAIHSPYNVGCKACHGYDFMRIHVEKKPFPPQFPIPQKPKKEQKGWI